MAPAKGEVVHELHRNMDRRSVCVGCGCLIQDQFIMKVAPDMEWHASCLTCVECSLPLDESCTCFVRDGRTYCKRDYLRLFTTKCSQCHKCFTKSDFVMRAKTNIYHVECFRCKGCSKPLVPGEEFALEKDALYCKNHSDAKPTSKRSKIEPDQGVSLECDKDLFDDNSMNSSDDMSDIEVCTHVKPSKKSGSGKSNKPTRIRTVLTEKQLHTLRTCYGANPRPDALMKEQLTEMTGLPQRVIRVWFQNKRCKDKKKSILITKIQQEKAVNRMGGGLQGVAMVAASPIRHESPLQANQIEVQSYQTPWKGIDTYMHGDMPHPAPFQQLMNSFDKDPELYSSPEGEMYTYMNMSSYSDGLSPQPPGSVSSGFSGSPIDLSPVSQ